MALSRLGIWLMCWLAATAGGAPAFPLPAYTVRTWSTGDGLPHDSVTAIAQTDDGYLWIGTPGGLARFNGVRFTVFNDNHTPGLRDNQIRSLFKDQNGTLWIGHDTGELTRYRDGRFESVHIKPAWKKPMIWHLGSDAENNLWLMNDEGLLFRVRDGLLLTPQAGKSLGFFSFERSDDGTMWIGRNGVLSRFQNGRLTGQPFDQSALEFSYVQCICPVHDGGFWVASNGRLRKWDGRTWVDDLGACPWGMAAITRMIETREGFLAAGTPDQGLFLIQPHGETKCFNRANGFHDDWVTSLYEDREGNLWVGTGANGLVMLRRSLFTTVAPPDRWRGRAVTSVAAGQNGDLWIGTAGAGLYRDQQGSWTNWGVESGVSNPYLWSVLDDVRGNVWLGTSGSGLFVQHDNRVEPAPGWENQLIPVMALFPRMAGGLWVGTSAGLAGYMDGKTSWPTANSSALPDVRTVVEDQTGAVWFGMNGCGLGRLKDGQVTVFRKRDGLASDFVRCLHLEENDALWIGTSDGLNRLKQGRFATIGPDQGLPDMVISDIESDGQGHFWISSNSGILRADKTDLDRCADEKLASVPFRLYGKSDGLPTVECSGGFQPAGCRDTNGWLYFPTSKGVVTVNPKNVGTNSLPPPVVIEALRMDEQLMPLPSADGPAVEIPPGRYRLEFDYAGLSFVAPEKVRYQCRLQGLENKWVNVGTKTSESYSYVPPGHYVFHVIACNNDGVWNESGATLAFTALPYFWQTWWFRLVAGTAAALGIAAGGWWKAHQLMRRKIAKLEQQRLVERERTRIAKDIHDDLGTSLTGITMLSRSARAKLEDSVPATSELDRILGITGELTRRMDEIVWAVNPQHDTLEGLVSYLVEFAQEFLTLSEIRCRLEIPIHLPAIPMSAEVRHNLFLAFKETLNNVVRYAVATEVKISLSLEPDRVRITVTDNGRGFNPGSVGKEDAPDASNFGNGLRNLRERLEKIGSHCEITSAPGKGTQVSFNIKTAARAGN